jgi:hypothetical protein
MSCEVHVRFCEGLAGKFRRSTLLVIACEHLRDAEVLRETLEGRLQGHGLEVNESKTKLLRFGKGSDGGGGESKTFDFLGFTHIAGKSRAGWYLVQRKTARKRFTRSLKVIAQWCRENRHAPLKWQWQTLNMKLRGHYNYYGVRGNSLIGKPLV